MRKITKVSFVQAHSITALSVELEECLSNGWELRGGLSTEQSKAGIRYTQQVVQYSDSPSDESALSVLNEALEKGLVMTIKKPNGGQQVSLRTLREFRDTFSEAVGDVLEHGWAARKGRRG